MRNLTLMVTLLTVCLQTAAEDAGKREPPAFELFRAEEDYGYLADRESSPYEDDVFDPVKYIPLDQDGNAYLTLGGEVRPRFEFFTNRHWEAGEDEEFYSQRISLHANWRLGKTVRVFTELYHGYTSHEKEFAEYDELDWHQAFLELASPALTDHRWSLRLGRQELALGAARLIGLREGPNIRRSFDAVRAIYSIDETTIQAFYGREVLPEFDVFDNDFDLFDGDSTHPELWGVYSQFMIRGDVGPTELYYLGFRSDTARFNDVTGNETRHSIGIRRFGRIGQHWVYNTEAIYQCGELGGQDIRAWNIETDWHYELVRKPWRPSIGLKLELTSGDDRAGDNEVNSFNPMFVNPAYYSLATTITPVNMKSIHPSLTLHPTAKVKLYFEWASFWRESKNDGLYSPPRFLARDGVGVSESKIGNQMGAQIGYEIGRHMSFDADVSYFIADDFLEATGEAEDILHIAPTFSFKF
jgi:hypothetical protein